MHVYQSIEGVVRPWVLGTIILQVSSLPYHILQSFVRPYELFKSGTTKRQQPSVRGKVGHQEQEGGTVYGMLLKDIH
jgi:hypothetical protein